MIERRVEKAKALLLQGAVEIAEVARRVGFADRSHLGRHTKALLGSTGRERATKGER